MSWRVTFDEARALIHLSYAGRVSPPELLASFLEAARLTQRTGVARFFTDCRALTGGHDPIDLYEIISLFEREKIPRTMREAVVLPSLHAIRGDVAFFETACLNRGYNVRVFDDADAAIAWLLGG